MKETKLLNCPFCGGEAKLSKTHEGQYGILHDNEICPIDSTGFVGDWYYDTAKEAISAWNTRKPMERILERLEDKQNENRYKSYVDTWNVGLDQAIEIVKEEGGLE